MKSLNKFAVLVTTLYVINLLAYSERSFAQTPSPTTTPSGTSGTYNNPSDQTGTGTNQTGTGTIQSGSGTNQTGTGTNQTGTGTNQIGTGTNQSRTGSDQTGTGTHGTMQNQTGTMHNQTGTMNNQTGMVNRSEKDVEFVKDAAMLNLKEIKLGQLAQTKGKLKDVRDLGAMMVRDHRKSHDELTSLAARKGIQVPTVVDVEGQNDYDKLSRKTNLDEDYTEEMVKGHRKAIAKFETASKESTDPEIATWASNQLPALRTHLQHSEMSHDMTKHHMTKGTKKSKTKTQTEDMSRGKND